MKLSHSSVTSAVLLALAASNTCRAFAPSLIAGKQQQSKASTLGATTTEESSTTMAPEVGRSYFVDEEAAFERSTFPIAPADLIASAKSVMGPECGVGTKDGGASLSESFQFCAAVVGPIGKKEYLGALKSFDLESALEISQNLFGFSVDPLQPNRVWFFSRAHAIHSRGPLMGAEPTGKEIIYPPQTFHLDFDKEGKVTEFGFYTVDRHQGTTGGLGGAFGFFYAVGKPLPFREAKPYKKSFRFRLLTTIGDFVNKRQEKKN